MHRCVCFGGVPTTTVYLNWLF